LEGLAVVVMIYANVLRYDAPSIGKYVVKDIPEVLATSVFKVDCRNQRWPKRGLPICL